MLDKRYDFPVMAASKVIIQKGDEILLTREPKDHIWMPGRLGLPGGKFYLNESILEGTERKIQEETGLKCKLRGLFEIVNILMPKKTTYHFIFIADYVSGEVDLDNIYSAEVKWFSREEIMRLSKKDLTEYYLDEVLQKYFKNPDNFMPLEKIRVLFSFKDKRIQDWTSRGAVKE
jgi:ADP-ribose pyrophosphatase YjhB (NUDIX family)